MQTDGYQIKRRRYDLDWLRVLAFGLLILYHTGMFYVADWGWHIKSADTSETLQVVMMLVNPWRMPLLFFISGAALWFASRKVGEWSLVRLRITRLLPPLVLGMLVIVPPQMYFQLIQFGGADFSYFEFYPIYLDTDTALFPEHQTPVGLMTWNHLWFLPYLVVYSLMFAVLKPALDWLATRLHRFNVPLVAIYLVPTAIMAFYSLVLEPRYPATHALVGDWYQHAKYFTIFVFGYLFAGHWQVVRSLVSARWFCLGLSLVTYVTIVLLVRGVLPVNMSQLPVRILVVGIFSLNGCAWLLTVLAWAAAFLNRPSRALSYMNEAILPWYVLHQTITIILAWHLSKLGWNTGLEAMLVLFGTVAGCALGYEIIKRFTVTRFLFGLKLERKSPDLNQSANSMVETPVRVESRG